MGACKITIQVDLGMHIHTFWHNQANQGIIQAYHPYIFKTMCNPALFRIMAYSEQGVYSEDPVKHPRWSILRK